MFLASQQTGRVVAISLAAFGTLAITGAAMAQAIVVRSTGPSAAQYPQGRKLPADASVALKPGDKLTVLDKSGTRVFSGPGNFALSAASQKAGGTTLAAVMTGSGGRTRTGAVRGLPPVSTVASPDTLWSVDVTHSGTYCVADPSVLVLWRPDRTTAATGKLAASGKTAVVKWGAGSALKLWPVADLPVTDGQTYSFAADGATGKPISFTLKTLGAMPEDQLSAASLLAEKGCNAQLDMIANSAAGSSASR